MSITRADRASSKLILRQRQNHLHERIEIGVDMAVERESINFKLPKALTAALRAKAHSLNTTATDLVIQGLHHVLGLESNSVDSMEQDLLHDIISRLEAKLQQETIPAFSRSTVEQLRERTSTQSLAIAQLQQEVKTLLKQVSGLETAMLSLASQENSTDVSKGDRACAIPDSETDITQEPDRKYLLCPECLARGWSEESFTSESG